MKDIQLTEHFKLSEFTHSDTAMRMGIDNTLDPDKPEHKVIIENLRRLCENVLEPLRAYINASVIINSGYRCPELNNAVGGAKNSKHLTGNAADIRISSVEQAERIPNKKQAAGQDLAAGRKWFEYLKTLKPAQLIWETNKRGVHWIHVAWG